ncbi:MAG: hypothetical protein E6G94_02315 [Alphaproteobacteria bacterium]|nr:MAG: hypothetical protein E6G94_02315 [Alphaproteobacteria bacterium]
MTTYTEQLRKLLEGLYLRTIEKSINWTYDESSDSCESRLGDGYVQVVGETDDAGDYYSFIKLLNYNKQVIDSIYGGSYGLKDHKPSNTGHPDYWKLIVDLKQAAERSALGADKVIETMLLRLNSDNLKLDDDEVPF